MNERKYGDITREKVLKYQIGNRKWVTDEVAKAIMAVPGYKSDIYTIPLKDAEQCPLELFEDNYGWSSLVGEDIPIREYVEKHGEPPKLDSTGNVYAYVIKHQDPRKLFYTPAAPKSKFSPHQAQIYLDRNSMLMAFSTLKLWDMGFWLYKCLMVKLSEINLNNLHLYQIKDEDTKDKNRKHPTSVGSNYYFRVYDPETKQFLIKADRYKEYFWTDKVHSYMYYNRAKAIRMYKALPDALKRPSAILIRYRLVVGKPTYMKDLWSVSEDRLRLTQKYRKGELTPDYNKFLQYMHDSNEWWQSG